MNYRYVSAMPLDGSRSIVHLKADNPNAKFRFISLEKTKWVENNGFAAHGREDIIVIPLSSLKSYEGITEDLVKYELSKLHGCSPDEITISISHGPRHRDGATDRRKYRRKIRYSHGLDPNMPPPGWIQD